MYKFTKIVRYNNRLVTEPPFPFGPMPMWEVVTRAEFAGILYERDGNFSVHSTFDLAHGIPRKVRWSAHKDHYTDDYTEDVNG